MIIVMEQTATDTEVQQMVDRVEEAGLKAILLRGEVRKVIAAIGDKHEAPLDDGTGARRRAHHPHPQPLQDGQPRGPPGATPCGSTDSSFGGTKVRSSPAPARSRTTTRR